MEPDNIPASWQLNPAEKIELGKALCDRLGLNLGTTMREWSSEKANEGKVAITMTTWVLLDQDEFEDLQVVAAQRVAAATAAAAAAIPAAPETKPEGTSK